jgi:hypothetical protein
MRCRVRYDERGGQQGAQQPLPPEQQQWAPPAAGGSSGGGWLARSDRLVVSTARCEGVMCLAPGVFASERHFRAIPLSLNTTALLCTAYVPCLQGAVGVCGSTAR